MMSRTSWQSKVNLKLEKLKMKWDKQANTQKNTENHLSNLIVDVWIHYLHVNKLRTIVYTNDSNIINPAVEIEIEI